MNSGQQGALTEAPPAERIIDSRTRQAGFERRHWISKGERGMLKIVSNQNLQIFGVTNVTSSQAMTAIPLPIER
jgi:hypothetical protein